MLNWIAYWGGSYLFGRGGPLQNHVDKAVPISDDIVAEREAADDLGQPAAPGAAHRHLHRARCARRLLPHPQPHDARLRGARGRLQSRGRALRRHQRRAQLHRRDGDLRPLRRASPAASTSSAGSSASACSTFRCRTSASSASRSRCSGATPRSESALQRSSSARLLNGTSTRSLDPSIFPPQLAGNLALMIQALVLLFVGADLLILYIWQARKKLRMPGRAAQPTRPHERDGVRRTRPGAAGPATCMIARVGIVLGLLRVRRRAAAVRCPRSGCRSSSGSLRVAAGIWASRAGCAGRGGRRSAFGIVGIGLGVARDPRELIEPRPGRRVVGTPLRRRSSGRRR